ncbi:MAG: sigma-70 family RNA polymerase sigma factor [Clostridium sp.]|nr:sigma-70 family RNA polymerase sigma factor [Clostridium sp.]MCM1444570.1 sigma-70 family RNA polymerase sigma factor [Candidatus Amulumruptor caecigallinarius]
MNNKLFMSENIPEELTKEQEYVYLKKYQIGDNDARNKLILHSIKLVIDYVHENFSKVSYDEEELISLGLETLIKYVDSFKFESNYNFKTYLICRVNNAIKRFIEKEEKYDCNKIESLDVNYCDQDDMEDFSIDFVTLLEDKFEYEKVKNILEKLSYIDKKIIHLYFYDKYNEASIAKLLSCTPQNVSIRIKKILKKITFFLKREGVIENQEEKVKQKK